MRFLRTYARVLLFLGRDLRVAGLLAGANLMVAGLQFLDPVLFGRVVNLLSRSDNMPHAGILAYRPRSCSASGPASALVGIGSNILVSVQTERLAHRHRIRAMSALFPPCADPAAVVPRRDPFRPA